MKLVEKYLLKSLFFLAITFFISCGSAQTTEEEKAALEEVEQLIQNKEFKIEHEWLMPLGGGMINLINNPNFIHFKKDSVELFLPYFGVRQFGGGYGSSGGLEYNGPIKELEITKKDDENYFIMKFSTEQDMENLRFRLNIYSNTHVNTQVTSSQRNAISYRGNISELEKDDKKE